MSKIGLLLGSARAHGNTPGLATWLLGLLSQASSRPGPDPEDAPLFETVILSPSDPTYPSHPLTDPTMPALIQDPSQHASPTTRAFSAFVTSCSALIILTPQYNWGYPGGLKNALDHLYWEWRDKPFLIVTFGGHGGGKAAEQLAQVLEGGLKGRVLRTVGIDLPGEYTKGERRVGVGVGDGEGDVFLDRYVGEVTEAVDELLEVIRASKK